MERNAQLAYFLYLNEEGNIVQIKSFVGPE
jgi:hypothetical protein